MQQDSILGVVSAVPAGRARRHGPAPIPVHLSIPAIHVSLAVTRLGLQPDNTVQVPNNPALVGWYQYGPSPGQVGSSVILGHVDSLKGPAAFYLLSSLQPGNHVDVGRADGSVAQFEVRSVVTYPNESFPARKVYGSHGWRELNLITCGGGYDRQKGYLGNVVVSTRLRHISAKAA